MYCHPFQMVLVQVKTAGYQPYLQNYSFCTSAAQSFVLPIPLDPAKGTLCLNAAIHSQQRTVNTVQVVQNFFMELCQFRIDTNNTVSLALVTFLTVWTACAIFAPVVFFCPSIPIALDWCNP